MSPGQVRLAPRGRDEEGQAGGGATPHSRASTCPLHTARRCEPICEQAAALPASNVLSLARPRKRPRRREGEAEPQESPPQLIFASATVPGQGGPSAGAFAATVKSVSSQRRVDAANRPPLRRCLPRARRSRRRLGAEIQPRYSRTPAPAQPLPEATPSHSSSPGLQLPSSAISRLHLGCISAPSRLHLPPPGALLGRSPAGGGAADRVCARG